MEFNLRTCILLNIAGLNVLGNKVMQMRTETVTNDELVSMVTCPSLNPALCEKLLWLMC